MQVETIETERLYLRGFQKEDAVFAIGIWNDPEMGETDMRPRWQKESKNANSIQFLQSHPIFDKIGRKIIHKT